MDQSSHLYDENVHFSAMDEHYETRQEPTIAINQT